MHKYIRKIANKIIRILLIRSLVKSNAERGESILKSSLEMIVPDISQQYSTFRIDPNDKFLNLKIRCQHAFQVTLMLQAINFLKSINETTVNIVDIGDSAGTHILYINELSKDKKFQINTLSINLDSKAVEKIQARGLNAKLCRAESLHIGNDGFRADLFMLFEVLEHLFDPISFLRNIAKNSECRHMLITVPFLVSSRVGLGHIRCDSKDISFAENTHIFELSSDDWDLIFQFSGWRVIHRDIYTQYPKNGLYRFTKYIWHRKDYEGFYGVILERDTSQSDLYQDW
jgi:hypothetical protein